MNEQSPAQQVEDFTLDTYRYLRGGMVVMVVMLAAGVVGVAIGSHCWQGSISAYYYTPAHSVFIAAVCAIGVLMIVYRGSTDTEDALLNLAGVMAFVVAFVPTGTPGQLCGQVGPWAKQDAAITNNMWALIVALVFARMASWLLYRATGTGRPRSVGGDVTVWTLRALVALGIVGFIFFRAVFDAQAHGVAAIVLFLAIIATVGITAFLVHQQAAGSRARQTFLRVYQVIAGLMVVTLALAIGVHLLVSVWSHWVLALEAALIGEFALYWVVQTVELWKTPNRVELLPERLRPQLARKRGVPGPAGLVEEVRELRQLRTDERVCRAL